VDVNGAVAGQEAADEIGGGTRFIGADVTSAEDIGSAMGSAASMGDLHGGGADQRGQCVESRCHAYH
jgi:hypothetical protein